ncbi:MAG TPA: efflux RND transporter periplasmic adaptor subunit [Fimbriimonadales bacterium]|nr:efflux RND transporter periplasmic adaptor subunit [Fimbriimonadales bacterium]
MKIAFEFVKKHWFTLLLLAGSVYLARWIVITKRPPGAMTPIEAQAMDMTTMKAPPGVHPVAVETVEYQEIQGKEIFPATVQAYNDEEITARIQGRVAQIFVYPGDTVRPGQLLARLEADEYGAQYAEAIARADASSGWVTVAEREVERLRTAKSRAREEANAKQAFLNRAQAEREMSQSELERAKEEAKSKQAMISEREAELIYAEQKFERDKKLYEGGAISLNEFQASQSERKTAAAKLESAKAEARAAERMIAVAEKRLKAAEGSLEEARAQLASANTFVKEVEKELQKAQSEVIARQRESIAERKGAGMAGAFSSYRELRALGRGVVSERVLSPGSLVMPGQTVLRIKVTEKVRIQVQLPERLLDVVREGTPVEIISNGNARKAFITSIFGAVRPETRTFTAEALIDNSERIYFPGQFVEVAVAKGKRIHALAVRSSAVKTDADGKRFVWVMVEKEEKNGKPTDWTCTMHPEVSEKGPGICPICKMDLVPRTRTGKYIATRRYVTTGAEDGKYTAILSGLQKGDKVIWAGHENLTEGAAVEETEWSESGPKKLPMGTGKTTHIHGAPPMTSEKESMREEEAHKGH